MLIQFILVFMILRSVLLFVFNFSLPSLMSPQSVSAAASRPRPLSPAPRPPASAAATPLISCRTLFVSSKHCVNVMLGQGPLLRFLERLFCQNKSFVVWTLLVSIQPPQPGLFVTPHSLPKGQRSCSETLRCCRSCATTQVWRFHQSSATICDLRYKLWASVDLFK